jgi:hypothetical protein
MSKTQFNLSKSAKRMMSLTYNASKANMFKKVFIDAEKAEAVARQQRSTSKESADNS